MAAAVLQVRGVLNLQGYMLVSSAARRAVLSCVARSLDDVQSNASNYMNEGVCTAQVRVCLCPIYFQHPFKQRLHILPVKRYVFRHWSM